MARASMARGFTAIIWEINRSSGTVSGERGEREGQRGERALERFKIWNQKAYITLCFIEFSWREPLSASLEKAL